jgi:KDO2-lipid IV(A) lauroyltransferase
MERTERKELLKIKNRIYNPNKMDTELYSASHAFCCANFQTFLPELKNTDHTSKFRDVVYSQAKAKYERIDAKLIDNVDLSELNLLKERAYIFCSFHYGSYKIIASSLLKLNVPFFVAINDSMSKKDIKDDDKYFSATKKRYANTKQDKMISLSVNDTRFALKSAKLIKEGYSMLIFIDGNSGSDGIMEYRGKNTSKISFFNEKIYVKDGLPALAYLYNVPILPVIAFRKDESIIKVKSFTPFYPNLTVSRKEFAFKTTTLLYKLLESLIIKNPFEWEGWLYIHKWIDFEILSEKEEAKSNNSETPIFNSRKYIPFIIKDKKFLLDKDTHLAYEIDDIVQRAIDGKINNLNKEELTILTNKKILI